MSDFNPGGGWREVESKRAPYKDYLYLNEGGRDRWWIRRRPVPPLPTEPHTVILADWQGEFEVELILTPEGMWGSFHGQRKVWAGAEYLARYVTGFEVLASPERWLRDRTIREEVRRETAKAVLARVRELPTTAGPLLDQVAREFRVES